MDFKNIIHDYITNATESDVEPTLAGFLEEMVLDEELGDQDDEDQSREKKPREERVQMMTMHAAKGLEFPVVFLLAMEDGVFPSDAAIGEPAEMEEERRICYVAMTRAKKQLFLTATNQRMRFGQTRANRPSRFVSEIPEQYLERQGRSFLDRDRDTEWSPGIPSRTSGYGGYEGGYGGGMPRRPAPVTTYRGNTTTGASKYPLPPRKTTSAPVGGVKSATTAPSMVLQKGDMVNHKAFGRGMVISTQKTGGDVLVEIAFDNVGTKRLMLKFAAAQMTKL